MTVVKDDIRQAVLKELEVAERAHGLHHSDAEKYAVMLEELQEAEEELAHARERLAGFWSGVRLNREDWTEQQAVRIAEAAERAACECVQLAAMARKIVALDPLTNLLLAGGAAVGEGLRAGICKTNKQEEGDA